MAERLGAFQVRDLSSHAKRKSSMIRISVVPILAALLAHSTMLSQDTTWVQTYTWEAQNNPETAYDSPGRRWFDFPASDNGQSYSKVLMYHNLKCFEQGTAGGLGYACGEWDYLTYSYLFDHTGVMDSSLFSVPRWKINALDFETDTLILAPTNGAADTVRYTFTQAVISSAEAMFSGVSSPQQPTLPFTASNNGAGRAQWLWTGQELTDMQLPAGTIDGFSLPWNEGDAGNTRVKVRIAHAPQDSLNGFVEADWVTIYEGLAANGTGYWGFDQGWEWDGASAVVVDCAWDGGGWDADGLWATEAAVGQTWTASAHGSYLALNGGDYAEIDPIVMAEVSDQVTVECWQRGNADFQPENNSIIEGFNANNQREINVHLPWSNGRVYWDAGYDGGYDRIDQAANAEDYEGQWNHWAFTKDASAGVMNIYLNGTLWHSGSNKDNTFGEVVRLVIGARGNADANFYRGDLDEFRLWNVALEEATIKAWMSKTDLANHPHANALKLHESFDEANGEYTASGWLHGDADRVQHAGAEAFLDAGPYSGEVKPAFGWVTGASWGQPQVVDVDVLDPIAPLSVSEWAAFGNSALWVDLNYGYPAETVITTRTPDGTVLATYPMEGEAVAFSNEQVTYYGVPFEVVDRYELARYITPYGINLSLDDDGWTWVVDVTDYLPLLRDSVELEAGNWQELLDLKFAFIHGTPPRDVKRVDSFWHGTIYLNTFDEQVIDHAFTPEAGEEMFRLVTRASGHGFGTGNNCAEFCDNLHTVKVNGNPEWTWEIMRECADNALYPQGGTWIYDRAGWCPGALVDTKVFELTPLVNANEPFNVDYDITWDPDGNYRMEGQIIAYGPPNMQVDAEIMEILSPSDFKLKSRVNPVCESPEVVLRNNGATPLTSCTFTYGIQGGEVQQYDWAGTLGFLESETVALPFDDPMFHEGGNDEVLTFEVSVSAFGDEEPGNDLGRSTFRRVPTWAYNDLDDNRIVVWTKTNSVPIETTVELTDASGNVVWSRGYNQANATIRDTISINQGCYRFTVHDSGDDGMSFWANNDGSGYVRLKKVASGNFIVFEPDFGKSISQAFFFQTNVVSVEEPQVPLEGRLRAFPNPAVDQMALHWAEAFAPEQWVLRDVQGRQVLAGQVPQGSSALTVPVSTLGSGTYHISITGPNGIDGVWVQVE